MTMKSRKKRYSSRKESEFQIQLRPVGADDLRRSDGTRRSHGHEYDRRICCRNDQYGGHLRCADWRRHVLGLVNRDKVKTMKQMRTIMQKFQDRNHATQCRLLKGVDTHVVLRPCPLCVADACEFLEEELEK